MYKPTVYGIKYVRHLSIINIYQPTAIRKCHHLKLAIEVQIDIVGITYTVCIGPFREVNQL